MVHKIFTLSLFETIKSEGIRRLGVKSVSWDVRVKWRVVSKLSTLEIAQEDNDSEVMKMYGVMSCEWLYDNS